MKRQIEYLKKEMNTIKINKENDSTKETISDKDKDKLSKIETVNEVDKEPI